MKLHAGMRFRSGAAPFAMQDLFRAGVALGAGLAIVISVCLMALTTRLNDDAGLIANAVESVRLAKSMERLIARHHRSTAPDPSAGREIEQQVRSALAQAEHFLVTPEERAVFESARTRIERYLEAGSDARPELEGASAGIAALVEVNVAHVEAVHARIRGHNLLANVLGGGATGLILLGTAALVLWSRRAAFQPIRQIHEAMARYGAGDVLARAPVEGFRELAEIAGVFNRLADSLDDRHQRQLAFLAGVAHDLRNPLSAMTLAVQGLRRRTHDPEKVDRTIELLTNQMKKLERMLMDFVDASRIESGEFKLVFERTDACAVVREVVSLFSASSDRHEITLALTPDSIEIDCDSTRLSQVLANLVSNAIKYSPGGGRIRIEAATLGSEVRIAVSDEGVGIAAGEQAAQLFQPFRRASRTGDIPGTGLGLYVVSRLVKAHGGRIEVESHEGLGSTFAVFLPRVRPPAAKADIDSPSAQCAVPRDRQYAARTPANAGGVDDSVA